MQKNNYLSPYAVGALLYAPAVRENITDSVINEKLPKPFSLALCLEDTIADNAVKYAEDVLVKIINELYTASLNQDFYMPNIFIRVRYPEQIFTLIDAFGKSACIIAGFIAPKFTLTNSKEYIDAIKSINKNDNVFHLMPVLESSDLFHLDMRSATLNNIKSQLDSIKDYVLNIRVGGNDFLNYYGLRRHYNETIYEIGIINSILIDILTMFSADYIVSAPVWEYFDNGFETGLINEIKMDIKNGFIGKTVIHPNQIPYVNKYLAVRKSDFEDAKIILNMSNNEISLVGKNVTGSRMNEYKTHYNWANKIINLYKIYGTIDE